MSNVRNEFFLSGFYYFIETNVSFQTSYLKKTKKIYSFTGMTIPEAYSEVYVHGLENMSIVFASAAAIRVISGTSKNDEIYFINDTISLHELNRTTNAIKMISDIEPWEKLTMDESMILKFLNDGMTMTEIADSMSKSVKTISYHKLSAMRKLHVCSNIELHFKTKLIGLI